jgi:hypothetical protein
MAPSPSNCIIYDNPELATKGTYNKKHVTDGLDERMNLHFSSSALSKCGLHGARFLGNKIKVAMIPNSPGNRCYLPAVVDGQWWCKQRATSWGASQSARLWANEFVTFRAKYYYWNQHIHACLVLVLYILSQSGIGSFLGVFYCRFTAGRSFFSWPEWMGSILIVVLVHVWHSVVNLLFFLVTLFNSRVHSMGRNVFYFVGVCTKQLPVRRWPPSGDRMRVWGFNNRN